MRGAEPGGRAGSVRAVGDRAVIADLPDLAGVLAVSDRLRASALPGVIDIVPATRTVLVVCASRADARRAATALGEAAAAATGSADGPVPADAAAREVVIDTVYDGADLAAVGELTGLGAAGVIAAHTGTAWRAAFGGFAPGFVYLAGGDSRLDVPRLDAPRTAVPAGAVAIAGGFSAVYPGASPGGWRLLGRATARMWDAARDRAALVAPGDTVRFRAVREAIGIPGDTGTARAAGAASASAPAGAALVVERPGPLALVEDLGRPGRAALGVTGSGALDRGALRRANRAVGNPEGAAGLELVGGGAVLRAERPTVVALAPPAGDGAGTGPESGPVAPVAVHALAAGERVAIPHPARGLRTYVAVAGGIVGTLRAGGPEARAPEAVLGSLSHDTLSGLGAAPLAAGDGLVAGEPSAAIPSTAPTLGPRPDPHPVLRFVPGPRDDWFAPGSVAALEAASWTVTPQSNRVGLRLEGPPLERACPAEPPAELPTEGMVRGAIQVPPNGRPVLFLADHPVTGGYPVIGTVVDDDLDRAAQLAPGDAVRFAAVDPDRIGAPLGHPAPERAAVTLEVDGRRVPLVVPGALAAAIDRAAALGDEAPAQELLARVLAAQTREPPVPGTGTARAD